MAEVFDVAVIGAGPAGSATGAFLARQGLRVLLLDKADFPRDKTCGDALSPRAIHFLHDLDLGKEVEKSAFQVNDVVVTSPEGSEITIPISPHPDYPPYGYIVPRLDLDDLIRERALSAGAEFRGGMRVLNLHPNPASGITLSCRGQRGMLEIEAHTAVIATGANLALLRQLDLIPQDQQLSYAARAYFEGVRGLGEAIHIRFDGIPLPGYGWLFPLRDEAANIGAGFYRRGRHTPPTAREATERFLEHPPIHNLLKGSVQNGPIRGFPIRTDFHRSPIVGPRILLVGEAAGLVNPFTGEGVDYALESAHIASAEITAAFSDGDPAGSALSARFERAMRDRFQRSFVSIHLLRSVYVNALLLNPLVRACGRWPDLGRLLIDIMLEYQNPAHALRPRTVARVLRCILPR
jgi:geranylgeranyl reductase family protein